MWDMIQDNKEEEKINFRDFKIKITKCLLQVQLGLEPRTSRVWSERDNHYTIEPAGLNSTFSLKII